MRLKALFFFVVDSIYEAQMDLCWLVCFGISSFFPIKTLIVDSRFPQLMWIVICFVCSTLGSSPSSHSTTQHKQLVIIDADPAGLVWTGLDVDDDLAIIAALAIHHATSKGSKAASEPFNERLMIPLYTFSLCHSYSAIPPRLTPLPSQKKEKQKHSPSGFLKAFCSHTQCICSFVWIFFTSCHLCYSGGVDNFFFFATGFSFLFLLFFDTGFIADEEVPIEVLGVTVVGGNGGLRHAFPDAQFIVKGSFTGSKRCEIKRLFNSSHCVKTPRLEACIPYSCFSWCFVVNSPLGQPSVPISNSRNRFHN
jgi:hypothetical protein